MPAFLSCSPVSIALILGNQEGSTNKAVYWKAGTGFCRVNNRTTKRNDSNYTKDILLPSSLNQYFFFKHIIIPRVLSVLIGLLQALKEGTMHCNQFCVLPWVSLFSLSRVGRQQTDAAYPTVESCPKITRKEDEVSLLPCYTVTQYFHRQLGSLQSFVHRPYSVPRHAGFSWPRIQSHQAHFSKGSACSCWYGLELQKFNTLALPSEVKYWKIIAIW